MAESGQVPHNEERSVITQKRDIEFILQQALADTDEKAEFQQGGRNLSIY